jgi:plasmid stabilization system protein ParE
VLSAIYVLLTNQAKAESKVDFWDELPESVKNDIDEAIKEADRGEKIPHKEAMKQNQEENCILMKVSWTPKALKSFMEIVDFLNEKWTKKEVDAFAEQTDKVIEQIAENPYMFVATEKRKNVRKGLVNKLVSLFYRVKPRKKEIELLRFSDNRMDPDKLEY